MIDDERFHVSAHGRISCQDCHEDIAAKQLHPNPEDVNKSLNDFFRPEQCTGCHEDVLEETSDGTHGGEKISDQQEFSYCISCHDPHYQLSYSDTAEKIDLTQPVEKKCGLCHDHQKDLPEFTSKDKQCLRCHGAIPAEDAKAAEKISNLCFHCHGSDNALRASPGMPLIDRAAYRVTAHSEIACTACHPEAVGFKHAQQKLGDCRRCHNLHDEKKAHDLHFRVSCQACHLTRISPIKDKAGGVVNWQRDTGPGGISHIHDMVSSSNDALCKRCHFSGNSLGAAAMVLPAKGLICMPCHAATFSVGDTTTRVALIVSALGFLSICSVWFSGSLVSGQQAHLGSKLIFTLRGIAVAIFSIRIVRIIKILILDGLLQRRLYQISISRWLIHALIFFPFLMRFCWGSIALVASLGWPQWPGAWIMLNKDHPLTALFFDLSGVLTMIGVGLILRRKVKHPLKSKIKGLPKTDWTGYSLLGGIMIAGFILEGMRIAMTGTPAGSHYAFLGYAISRLFTDINLTHIYGYMWYGHAILTGAFLAYLPFSRMVHMIMAPVSLAMNIGAQNNHRVIDHG